MNKLFLAVLFLWVSSAQAGMNLGTFWHPESGKDVETFQDAQAGYEWLMRYKGIPRLKEILAERITDLKNNDAQMASKEEKLDNRKQIEIIQDMLRMYESLTAPGAIVYARCEMVK